MIIKKDLYISIYYYYSLLHYYMNIHTCMHACIHMMHASHTSIKKEVDKWREKEKSFSTCQGLGFQFPNAVEPCPATALVVFFFFFGLR